MDTHVIEDWPYSNLLYEYIVVSVTVSGVDTQCRWDSVSVTLNVGGTHCQ